MIFLAETSATPEAASFQQFFISLTAIIFAVVGVLQIISKWRDLRAEPEDVRAPQPFITAEAVQHAERKELDKLSTAVTALTQTVNSNHQSIILAGSEREGSIKELLRQEVSLVMRELHVFKDSFHQELSRIRERIASAETRLDHSEK